MEMPSAEKVVNPAESLRAEISGLTATLNDIEGKLLEIVVQRERLRVLRDCMVTGYRAMFAEHPADGQLDLPNLAN